MRKTPEIGKIEIHDGAPGYLQIAPILLEFWTKKNGFLTTTIFQRIFVVKMAKLDEICPNFVVFRNWNGKAEITRKMARVISQICTIVSYLFRLFPDWNIEIEIYVNINK